MEWKFIGACKSIITRKCAFTEFQNQITFDKYLKLMRYTIKS